MPGAGEALLVPLIFRGETLGVLAGIDREDGRAFDDEDEQLLMSVAASAATAVATARSVAAERLRLSLEAAEQARARWARELHDETLQGLTGRPHGACPPGSPATIPTRCGAPPRRPTRTSATRCASCAT